MLFMLKLFIYSLLYFITLLRSTHFLFILICAILAGNGTTPRFMECTAVLTLDAAGFMVRCVVFSCVRVESVSATSSYCVAAVARLFAELFLRCSADVSCCIACCFNVRKPQCCHIAYVACFLILLDVPFTSIQCCHVP